MQSSIPYTHKAVLIYKQLISQMHFETKNGEFLINTDTTSLNNLITPDLVGVAPT